jgi:hypothetical protein
MRQTPSAFQRLDRAAAKREKAELKRLARQARALARRLGDKQQREEKENS